jgi:nickel-type superoxide dismutase maturation protease
MRIAALTERHPHFIHRTTRMRGPTWKDRILYFLGLRQAFRVEGDSMKPTLNNDDVVLIEKTSTVAVGDVVLAQHPYKQSVRMLKRVEKIDENGRFTLVGDNPQESTDSRTFGTVSIEYIYGKAVCRLS